MKVLIAEDDPISRRLLEMFLQRWEFDVVSAGDGAEAWEEFLEQEEEIHLVLTDWMMPKVDGLELVRRIRGRDLDHYVYVILVTVRSRLDDVVEAMEEGADDFITKPFEHDELRVRLHAGRRIVNLERALAEKNRELKETQAALIQTEKLASVGTLAAGLAHEINNPLTYVVTNLAVLRDSVVPLAQLLQQFWSDNIEEDEFTAELRRTLDYLFEDTPPTQLSHQVIELFKKVEEGVNRVGHIVENLVDFASPNQFSFKSTNINDCVRVTLEMVRHDVEKRQITLDTSFGDIPEVQARPRDINQVLLNLVRNAIHATENAGRIHIATDHTEHPDLGEAVVLTIEDDGEGISERIQRQIFEPFFTTKDPGEGTGLGLYVSYRIIDDHDGIIEVDSEEGEGTTFSIFLPVRPEFDTDDS